jgi:hypothetical protein
MDAQQQERVRDLVQVLDHALSTAGCGVLEALNAVSVMSTSLAHSVGLERKEYLDNLASMFDMTNPAKQVTPIEGEENE